MSKQTASDLIRQTANLALQAASYLLPDWLPEGSRQGSEWVACNSVRGDRAAGSFGVSLSTGRWNDFADGSAHGGDLVSLLAYLRGCRQIEAAREIDRQLGLGLFEPDRTRLKAAQEQEQHRQQAEQNRHTAMLHEQARLEDKQREAAKRAFDLWNLGKPADGQHPYLKTKGVRAHSLRQLSGSRLLVPLCLDERLVNLQIIQPNGEKRFLAGGRVKGCYSPLGNIRQSTRVYVCEGWATGATLHAHTGQPVACAMNANNLTPVAVALRERYGDDLELVIAGDDDRQTRGNPGRAAANQAARAAGALVVFPDWPDDAPKAMSDFNDLHLWQRKQYREAQA